MKADRSELNNLSTDNPEKVKELTSGYEAWADRVGVISRETIDKKK